MRAIMRIELVEPRRTEHGTVTHVHFARTTEAEIIDGQTVPALCREMLDRALEGAQGKAPADA